MVKGMLPTSIPSSIGMLIASSDALVSRTSKHSGAVKSLQFNPFRSELLATAGAKGEVSLRVDEFARSSSQPTKRTFT